MADYSFQTTDRQEAAITAARLAHNNNTDTHINTNGGYLRFVLTGLIRSYLNEYIEISPQERESFLRKIPLEDQPTVDSVIQKVLQK